MMSMTGKMRTAVDRGNDFATDHQIPSLEWRRCPPDTWFSSSPAVITTSLLFSLILCFYGCVNVVLCCVTPPLPFWVFELLVNGEDQKWKLWNGSSIGSVRCVSALQKLKTKKIPFMLISFFVFVQYWLKKKKRSRKLGEYMIHKYNMCVCVWKLTEKQ